MLLTRVDAPARRPFCRLCTAARKAGERDLVSTDALSWHTLSPQQHRGSQPSPLLARPSKRGVERSGWYGQALARQVNRSVRASGDAK